MDLSNIMSFEATDKHLQDIEFCLTLVAYAPGGNTISCPVRASLGSAMLLGGIPLAIINYLGSAFTSDLDLCLERKAVAWKFLEYAGHGILNIQRAAIEAIPGIARRCLTLCYDYSGRRLLNYTDINVYRQKVKGDWYERDAMDWQYGYV